MDSHYGRPLGVRLREAVPAATVVLALLAALLLQLPRARLPISFDGRHVYLPMAQRILDDGWAFLAQAESLTVAPLAFLIPAAFGADGTMVRWSNIFLFGCAIVLAYVAGRRAHSPAAGALAASLLAVSPTVRPFIANVLTEPPFLFLLSAWAASIAALATGGTRRWIVAGGLALGLAALTRPVVLYFAPAMLLVFAWRAWRGPPGEAAPEWRLAALHALAFALPAAWIARNALVFGFPGVATGAGAALFFGVNPLVDGFDPAYFGMNYDSGGVHRDLSHLTVDSDRILRAVALTELRDTPWAVVLEMFARKTIAFLFVTMAETSGEPVLWQRAWRIGLVVGAAVSFVFLRRSVFVLVIGAFTAYMLAVHAPALYHHRYSVGSIDLPLTLLAGLGFAEACRTWSRAAVIAALGAFVLAWGVGGASDPAPLPPRPERIPHVVRWQERLQLSSPMTPGKAVIEFPIAKAEGTPVWDLSLLQLAMSHRPDGGSPGCAFFWLQFKGREESDYRPDRAVRVPLDGGTWVARTVNIGTTVPLALDRAGSVRLTFDCAGPGRLEVETAAVISPTRGYHYRDLYLQKMAAPE